MGAYKLIATFFGIGYMGKGGGTVAAFLTCALLYLSVIYHFFSGIGLVVFTGIVMLLGTLAAAKVERIWGKDNKQIVIDEVLGMSVSLLFLPINAITLLVGFVLFRFFDIVKPLGIRKTEKLPRGWGVMADDLTAGLYTNVLVQGLVYYLNQ